VPAGREADDGVGHEDAGGGDHADGFADFDVGVFAERGAFYFREDVDRHGFGRRRKVRQRVKHHDAIAFGFAESDDPAAADSDVGFADIGEGLKAVFVSAGRDDGGIEFGGGVEIVVVGIQPGLIEPAGLVFVEHAQRAADFDAEGGDVRHHIQNAIELFAVAHFAPGGAQTRLTPAALARRAISITSSFSISGEAFISV